MELSSTPDQAAGGTWAVDLTVLQHGRTPLDGVRPEIVITDGARREKFVATPAGSPGVYHADVVFPDEGTWRYAVRDGFGQRHTYPPVVIKGAAAVPATARSPRDDGIPLTVVALAVLVGLVAAGLTFGVQRRRRISPA